MNSYLIDTDWIIDYLKGKKDKVEHINNFVKKGLAISIISLAEVYEGVYFGSNSEKHLKSVKDFLSGVTVLGIDEKICQIFGRLRGGLRRKGETIDNFDLLIAATCLSYKLTLLTDNIKHFRRIEGLKLFNR